MSLDFLSLVMLAALLWCFLKDYIEENLKDVSKECLYFLFSFIFFFFFFRFVLELYRHNQLCYEKMYPKSPKILSQTEMQCHTG